MRLFILIVLLTTIKCSFSRNNVKSLADSMGQEVIEIGAPIKDLPPDLEEEPSAENDEEEKVTSTTILPGTKRELKKSTATAPVETRRKSKEVDKNNISSEKEKSDDEEAKIEKELAEIYKDSIDYKGDSSEVDKEVTVGNDPVPEKPALRAKTSFKFQPDVQNKKEIEIFRTSVDEISCQKYNKLTATIPRTTNAPGKGNMAEKNSVHMFTSLIPFALAIVFK